MRLIALIMHIYLTRVQVNWQAVATFSPSRVWPLDRGEKRARRRERERERLEPIR